MKTKSVLIIVTICSLLVTSNLVAQPKGNRMMPPPPDSVHVRKMVDKMARELSLTPEQKNEISTIMLVQMEAGKKKHDLLKSKRIEENEKTRNEVNEKIKAVLNDEQATAFVLFQEHHHPGRDQGNRHRPCPNN